MAKHHTRKFGFATRVLLPFIAVIISVVILEFGLRIFGDFGPRSGNLEPPAEWSIHNQYLHVMQPNYEGILSGRDFDKIDVRTNELGFRDDPWSDTQDSDRKTIFFVGDSYIFGWGVEQDQRIGQLLEKDLLLQACSTRVVNLAMPGWGTFHYLDALRTYSQHEKFDLVLIGLFVGNDFIDDIVVYEKYIQHDGERDNTKTQITIVDELNMKLREFLRTSPIFNLVKYSLWQVELFRDVFNSLELRNDRIALYQDHHGGNHDYFPLTMSALQQIADIGADADADIVFVLIPDHLQILSSHVFDDLDFDKPQRELAERLSNFDIPFLDLLEYFRQSPMPERLYFREDKHWSVDGHAFAASILAEIVKPIVCDKTHQAEDSKSSG